MLGQPFNPPHLIPLVELAGGEATAAWVLDEAERSHTRIGKVPVRLQKEIYSHVANRLQARITAAVEACDADRPIAGIVVERDSRLRVNLAVKSAAPTG